MGEHTENITKTEKYKVFISVLNQNIHMIQILKIQLVVEHTKKLYIKINKKVFISNLFIQNVTTPSIHVETNLDSNPIQKISIVQITKTRKI